MTEVSIQSDNCYQSNICIVSPLYYTYTMNIIHGNIHMHTHTLIYNLNHAHVRSRTDSSHRRMCIHTNINTAEDKQQQKMLSASHFQYLKNITHLSRLWSKLARDFAEIMEADMLSFARHNRFLHHCWDKKDGFAPANLLKLFPWEKSQHVLFSSSFIYL